MSERPFRPTGRLRYPEVSDIYRRPNPSLEKIAEIFEYALTVEGYIYSEKHLHRKCGDLANERTDRYTKSGTWEGTFEELRCCLFFEQRHWRNEQRDPEGEDLAAIIALHSEICARWRPDIRQKEGGMN
jgi:hypothetical protein